MFKITKMALVLKNQYALVNLIYLGVTESKQKWLWDDYWSWMIVMWGFSTLHVFEIGGLLVSWLSRMDSTEFVAFASFHSVTLLPWPILVTNIIAEGRAGKRCEEMAPNQ